MSDKAYSMVGVGPADSVFDALYRAAAAASHEEDRWLSADELADMLDHAPSTDLVRRECLRLLGEGRILIKTVRRGLAQRVPRFRVKENHKAPLKDHPLSSAEGATIPNDAVSGVKGGDSNHAAESSLSSESVVVNSPRNDPPHKAARRPEVRRLGEGRRTGARRKKNV